MAGREMCFLTEFHAQGVLWENCLVYQLSQIENLRAHFSNILADRFDAVELAQKLPEPHLEKYDHLLDETLVNQLNAQRVIDLGGTKDALRCF